MHFCSPPSTRAHGEAEINRESLPTGFPFSGRTIPLNEPSTTTTRSSTTTSTRAMGQPQPPQPAPRRTESTQSFLMASQRPHEDPQKLLSHPHSPPSIGSTHNTLIDTASPSRCLPNASSSSGSPGPSPTPSHTTHMPLGMCPPSTASEPLVASMQQQLPHQSGTLLPSPMVSYSLPASPAPRPILRPTQSELEASGPYTWVAMPTTPPLTSLQLPPLGVSLVARPTWQLMPTWSCFPYTANESGERAVKQGGGTQTLSPVACVCMCT